MKPIFWALGAAAMVACKKEDAHPAETQPEADVMDPEISAMLKSRDCDVLRAGIEDGQQRIADKVGSTYSPKAFEELAALRAELAHDAAGWSLGLEEDRKLAAAWSAMNLRAAAAERRVAASMQDAGAAETGTDAGPDASSAEAELLALARDEDEIFHDLHKVCPKLAPR